MKFLASGLRGTSHLVIWIQVIRDLFSDRTIKIRGMRRSIGDAEETQRIYVRSGGRCLVFYFFFPSSTIAASRSIKSIGEENAGENCTLSFEGRVRGTCGVTVYPREIIFPRRESATRLSNELQNSTRDIASTLFTIGDIYFFSPHREMAGTRGECRPCGKTHGCPGSLLILTRQVTG